MSSDSVKTVSFRSDDIELEGLLEDGSTRDGVIVTHPHPLYGGNMNNHVVGTIHQAFRNRGFTTLRFNFRGTGSSQGRYDNGIGEQSDLSAATTYLLEKNIDNIYLAGYSFGAWVNALAYQEKGWSWPMIMVSPPVGFIDFAAIGPLSGLELVVTGSLDDIAPPQSIQRMLPNWNPSANFKVIDGSDHFYSRHSRQLEEALGRHL